MRPEEPPGATVDFEGNWPVVVADARELAVRNRKSRSLQGFEGVEYPRWRFDDVALGGEEEHRDLADGARLKPLARQQGTRHGNDGGVAIRPEHADVERVRGAVGVSKQINALRIEDSRRAHVI